MSALRLDCRADYSLSERNIRHSSMVLGATGAQSRPETAECTRSGVIRLILTRKLSPISKYVGRQKLPDEAWDALSARAEFYRER